MKRFKLLVGSLLAIIGLSLLSVGVARAQHFTTSVDSKQTVNSSVYSFGHKVQINGTVNGDVYCAGQDVTINGSVHGDVICAAMNMTVKGKIDGSIRAAGQNVTIDAQVGHAASVASRQATIKKGATVGQDLTVVGDATVNGKVMRDVVLTGADVRIGATVGRNIRFSGTQLTLTDGAQVKGGVTYTSTLAMRTEGNTKIIGNTKHERPQKRQQKGAHVFGRTPMSILYIVSSFAVLCMVLVWFLPQQLNAINEVAVKRLGLTMLVGLASIFGFLFMTFMLAASVVGLPLAALTFLVGILVVILSGPVAAYYLGSMLRPKSNNPLLIMAVGSIVLGVGFIVPVIGALVIFATYLIGSGAMLLSLKHHLPKPTYKV